MARYGISVVGKGNARDTLDRPVLNSQGAKLAKGRAPPRFEAASCGWHQLGPLRNPCNGSYQSLRAYPLAASGSFTRLTSICHQSHNPLIIVCPLQTMYKLRAMLRTAPKEGPTGRGPSFEEQRLPNVQAARCGRPSCQSSSQRHPGRSIQYAATLVDPTPPSCRLPFETFM